DVIDGVFAGQALVRHQRVAIAEHVGALGEAARAIELAVARLALDVVRARAITRAGQLRAAEPAHDAADQRHGDHEAEREAAQRALHTCPPVCPPWRPAPSLNRRAPATPSAS